MVITTFHQRSILEIWKPEKVLIYYWNCWSLSTKFMNSVSWPSPFKEPLWLVYCLNVDVIDCTEKFEHFMPRKVILKGKIPPYSHPWQRSCDWSTDLQKCLWLVGRSDGGASPELPARGSTGAPGWPALLRAPGAGTLPQSGGMVRPCWPLLRLV
jgi:hypothetical protein